MLLLHTYTCLIMVPKFLVLITQLNREEKEREKAEKDIQKNKKIVDKVKEGKVKNSTHYMYHICIHTLHICQYDTYVPRMELDMTSF